MKGKKATGAGKKKRRVKDLKPKRNPRGGATTSVPLTNPARSVFTITSGLGVDKIYKP